MSGVGRAENPLLNRLFVLPTLSPKTRFAIKTALAVTLSYLGAMAMNWPQPYQGPIAIMVIAAAGPLRDSLGKGVLRVLGTIAGAILGLLFLGIFPQEPVLYFLSLSIAGGILVYLYHAWRGDNSIWMIMLIVMVLMYNNGEVDDRLVYALDRSWSTILGIFVYAMVNIYLWPEKHVESRVEKARALAKAWRKTAEALGRDEDPQRLLPDLRAAEQALERSLRVGATEYPGGIAFDRWRWESLWGGIQETDRSLVRLALMEWFRYSKSLEELLPESREAWKEIGAMMETFEEYWSEPAVLRIPPKQTLRFDGKILESLSALERARFLSLGEELQGLHETLRRLLQRLERIASPEPDPTEALPGSGRRAPRLVHWGDPDDIKATLSSLLIYWTGLGLWYFLNVPQGYTVAALAFALSLLILFKPLNPLVLIVVFSLSFLVSFVTYVWVLPGLHEWWELGSYMFLYLFAIYMFVPAALAIFFGLGLVAIQFIDNTMFFSFQLFITVLLVFYLLLGLLLIFNYLPFANRPETLFRQLEKRFRTLGWPLASVGLGIGQNALWRSWALAQIPVTVAKMRLWASKIDRKYFDRIDDRALERHLREAERAAGVLVLLEPIRKRLEGSAIVREWKGRNVVRRPIELSRLFRGDLEEAERRLGELVRELESELAGIEWRRYDRRELVDLARYITLRKVLYTALLSAERYRRRAGLEQLKWSRF